MKCNVASLLRVLSHSGNAVGEELKLLAMEASIAREFIPSQNKAAYIYILIDKRVDISLYRVYIIYFLLLRIRLIRLFTKKFSSTQAK